MQHPLLLGAQFSAGLQSHNDLLHRNSLVLPLEGPAVAALHDPWVEVMAAQDAALLDALRLRLALRSRLGAYLLSPRAARAVLAAAQPLLAGHAQVRRRLSSLH